MKVFLIILCSLSFCINAFTQITYSNSYDITETADNGQRILKKDSLIFTVSVSGCVDTQFDTDCTGILCTNLAGEEVWKMVIDSSRLSSVDAVIMVEDHIYLALHSRTESYRGARIFKVDFLGNLVESVDIIEEDFLVYGIHKVEDGFKLHVGKPEQSLEIYGALVYLNESYEQVLLTRYTFMNMFEFSIISMVELGDDGSNIIIKYTGTDLLGRWTIIRLDSIGNVLWTYPMLGENTPIANNLSIFHLPDEGLFVTFQVGDVSQPLGIPRQMRMAKFTEAGELIWSEDIGLSSDVIITNPFLTDNNELIASGLLKTDSLGPFQGYICRFDLDRNILWERAIIEEQFSTVGSYVNYLNNGLELDNGDLLFCGRVNDQDTVSSSTSTPYSNIWLVRTTEDGCLDIDDCDNFTSTQEVVLENQVNFTLHPNPVGFYVTVDLENLPDLGEWNIRVFNANGQLKHMVQTRQFPYQISTENLATGFYFLELTNQEGASKTLKFVRQ